MNEMTPHTHTHTHTKHALKRTRFFLNNLTNNSPFSDQNGRTHKNQILKQLQKEEFLTEVLLILKFKNVNKLQIESLTKWKT